MFHGTTIISVRRGENVVVAGDGQVTFGDSVVLKHTARKVRRIHHDKVLCGFAGSTADALLLYEKLEGKLSECQGNLTRAAVELAKHWRSDSILRKLEALLICADEKHTYVITGNGDVIEPEEGLAAIGSGGNYAISAARALYRNTDFSAEKICIESLKVAAELCVYTNNHFTFEQLCKPEEEGE